jgi:hypothetical protein
MGLPNVHGAGIIFSDEEKKDIVRKYEKSISKKEWVLKEGNCTNPVPLQKSIDLEKGILEKVRK